MTVAPVAADSPLHLRRVAVTAAALLGLAVVASACLNARTTTTFSSPTSGTHDYVFALDTDVEVGMPGADNLEESDLIKQVDEWHSLYQRVSRVAPEAWRMRVEPYRDGSVRGTRLQLRFNDHDELREQLAMLFLGEMPAGFELEDGAELPRQASSLRIELSEDGSEVEIAATFGAFDFGEADMLGGAELTREAVEALPAPLTAPLRAATARWTIDMGEIVSLEGDENFVRRENGRVTVEVNPFFDAPQSFVVRGRPGQLGGVLMAIYGASAGYLLLCLLLGVMRSNSRRRLRDLAGTDPEAAAALKRSETGLPARLRVFLAGPLVVFLAAGVFALTQPIVAVQPEGAAEASPLAALYLTLPGAIIAVGYVIVLGGLLFALGSKRLTPLSALFGGGVAAVVAGLTLVSPPVGGQDALLTLGLPIAFAAGMALAGTGMFHMLVEGKLLERAAETSSQASSSPAPPVRREGVPLTPRSQEGNRPVRAIAGAAAVSSAAAAGAQQQQQQQQQPAAPVAAVSPGASPTAASGATSTSSGTRSVSAHTDVIEIEVESDEGGTTTPVATRASSRGRAESSRFSERTRRIGSPEADLEAVSVLKEAYASIREQMGRIIVGQDEVLDQILISIFSRSHCLLVGVPGLAKTLMIRTLADALSLNFNRIQFTPDLMPSDITGTEVIQEDKASGQRAFKFIPGPIFANVILADEINRTPPKTQAALLEAMQEYQVTAGGKKYELGNPFFVLATQNPIEQEGTYPLPEAQQDRFMFNIVVDYPPRNEELEIIRRTTAGEMPQVSKVLNDEDILALQRIVRRVPVARSVVQYAVNIVRATRLNNPLAPRFVRQTVAWGAGPRASQYLILGAKARAVLQGRYYVSTEDVRAVAKPVLRHRVLCNFSAEAEGVTSDLIVEKLIEQIPVAESDVLDDRKLPKLTA